MESKKVVAIEIASSKIKGALGAIYPDGRIDVMAIEEIPAINNVRYGRVQNIREVTDAISEIISRLEKNAALGGGTIAGAVFGIGGRSVGGVLRSSHLRFARECEITESLVQRLIYEASHDYVGDHEIIDVLPRMFYVNNTAVKKAVGNFADTLKGDFMMVTCAKETKQNFERLKFDNILPEHIHKAVRATAVADLVLASDEKEVGCMLVDFGAETSTVAIYRDGTLHFLSTVPMGSRLMTLDIMSGLGITEEAAEKLKTNIAGISDEATRAEVTEYVRARAGEIIANILNQLTVAGMTANVSKIVLTGGGARLPEFADMLSRQAKVAVRVAEMPGDVTFHQPGMDTDANIDVVALLWAGRKLPKAECVVPRTPEPYTATAPETETKDTEVHDVVLETTEAKESLFDDTELDTKADFAEKKDSDDDIDDDTLLADDPDDEEIPEEKAPAPAPPKEKRRGFNIFGKKKASPAPLPEEPEESEESEESEDESLEPAGEDSITNTPDDLNGITNILNNMRRSWVDFFRTPEEEEEYEEEEDDEEDYQK